jgi:hypothetical protein
MMKSITLSLVAIISAATIGCAGETAEEGTTDVDVTTEVSLSPRGGPPGPRLPGTPGCPYGCDGYGNPFPPPPPPPPPCTMRLVCGVYGPGCVPMCS